MVSCNEVQALLLARRRIEDGHWLWGGTIHQNGYGKLGLRYKQYWVHRLAAFAFLGLVLDDRSQQANHKPECLRRDCFNPDHLYVGTALENSADMMALGRHVSPGRLKTHCSKGHEFTPENTYVWVDSKGGEHRDCRECNRIKDRKESNKC